MFLVGVLTLLGYSINDTIVVFDRIRENILRDTNRDIVATANYSIMESMGRSINTSFTTLVVLLALFLLGPTTIRDFRDDHRCRVRDLQLNLHRVSSDRLLGDAQLWQHSVHWRRTQRLDSHSSLIHEHAIG